MLLRIIRGFFGFWLIVGVASIINSFAGTVNNPSSESSQHPSFLAQFIMLGLIYLIYYSLFKLINYLHRKKNKGTVEPLLKNQVISL